MIHTERFAPSPTGFLHLGHAYSALLAHDRARANDGRFLLRMEDLDTGRVRPAYADAIEEDLSWLGISWDGPVLCQSSRRNFYQDALQRLSGQSLTFPCICTRKDIQAAVSAPQENWGPDGPVYPGTCRGRSAESEGAAIRLDLQKSLAVLGGPDGVAALSYREDAPGRAGDVPLDYESLLQTVGDAVLCRRDGAFAYHLAVVVDDAAQGVTHVTRGEDLAPATSLHRILQALLGLPVPRYHHHRLIRDSEGKRLAKRHDALSLRELKARGKSPADIREMVGLT